MGCMEGHLLELGRGAYLYKTDLARGYRQLRVDPSDWPLLGFTYDNRFYFDMCPPLGLRTSSLCMQRTSEGIVWIHGRMGYVSRAYLDDFGGAEATLHRAERALYTLQDIMAELGVREAQLGFKGDLRFFLDLLPDYNGVHVVEKSQVPCQERLELDACLTGCGAFTGDSYYAERFPEFVSEAGHGIAHLELLNVIVAPKYWGHQWRGHTLQIKCDNMNACLAVQTGRSRDVYMQHCVREIFVLTVSFDIDLRIVHWPCRDLVLADALSRMHTDDKCRRWVNNDRLLRRARRVVVSRNAFVLDCRM